MKNNKIQNNGGVVMAAGRFYTNFKARAVMLAVAVAL